MRTYTCIPADSLWWSYYAGDEKLRIQLLKQIKRNALLFDEIRVPLIQLQKLLLYLSNVDKDFLQEIEWLIEKGIIVESDLLDVFFEENKQRNKLSEKVLEETDKLLDRYAQSFLQVDKYIVIGRTQAQTDKDMDYFNALTYSFRDMEISIIPF